jgi:excisionase family DNA binding protein
MNDQPERTVIEPLLKAADIAHTLNISRTQAYRLMTSGLPVVRFGSVVRVKLSDLKAFIEANRAGEGVQ